MRSARDGARERRQGDGPSAQADTGGNVFRSPVVESASESGTAADCRCGCRLPLRLPLRLRVPLPLRVLLRVPLPLRVLLRVPLLLRVSRLVHPWSWIIPRPICGLRIMTPRVSGERGHAVAK